MRDDLSEYLVYLYFYRAQVRGHIFLEVLDHRHISIQLQVGHLGELREHGDLCGAIGLPLHPDPVLVEAAHILRGYLGPKY